MRSNPSCLAPLALLALMSLWGCQSSSTTEQTPTPSSEDWKDYRIRSTHHLQLDNNFMHAEQAALGLSEPKLPQRTHRFGFEIDPPLEWYQTEDGRRVADILVSFQTPSGGWSKRTDMGSAPRQAGEAFGVELSYIPTFDNSATTTQLRILAQAYQANRDSAYLRAFLKGLNYILEAQYPNGGWPQSFPLRGGYHDYITYNDEVMENNLSLLHEVYKGKSPYDFIPDSLRKKAGESLQRGLELVVASQVVVNGQPTLWGGQHDPHTLEPRKARAYEMVALATAESVSLLDFMMDLEQPSEDLQNAIHSAMTWYRNNQILGHVWNTDTYQLETDADAPPLWSRFAEIGSNRPIFGDRDHSVHYNVEDISLERRKGYAWYTNDPNQVLKKYAAWQENFPR